jgi:hypothetical protein
MHGEMDSLLARLDPKQPIDKSKGITLNAGNQLKVVPKKGSEIVATIFNSAKPLGSYFQKDISPAIPGKDTGYPAVIVNRYGKGKVVYFSGQIDRLFYRIGHPDYERFLLNSLYFTGDKPPVTLKAPTTIETIFYQQKKQKRIMIHLLNHTYDQLFPTPGTGVYGSFSRNISRPVGDIIPVNGIEISLQIPDKAKIKKVFSMCTSKKVSYLLKKDKIQFHVPKLDEYDAFVIEYM